MLTKARADADAGGQYLECNGIRVFYVEAGSGPPLILLHGATDTHQLWRPHLAGLTPQYRVIMPDSRGHGRTLNPSRRLSYQLLADDLAGLIGALDLTQPYLCGYSDGGQAVLDFGLRYPGLAGALVIGGAWYRFSEAYRAGISAAGFVEPGRVDWTLYQRIAPPDWQDRLRSAHFDPDPDYPRILLEALARLWWTPLNYQAADFQQISDPTLILLGEKDEMIPVAEAREMAALIPGAELAIIGDARHNDVLLPGGEFGGHLLRFLSSIG